MVNNIAVCGSRRFPRLDLVDALVDSLPPDVVLHTGGAIGVDLAASRAAVRRGLPVVWHLAEVMPDGNVIRGGYIPRSSREFLRSCPSGAIRLRSYPVSLPRRNLYIIQAADFVHLFFVDATLSGGTRYSLQFCRELHVPYEVHFP